MSELGSALLSALRGKSRLANARPTADPQSVHEITGRLYAAYQVEGGHAHLGGCELENRPFLRLTFCDPQRPQEVWHRFVGPGGEPVDEELCRRLHLDQVSVCEGRRPRLAARERDRLLQAGQDLCRAAEAGREPLLETIVWCHFVRGKLTFEIGEATTDLAVSGWAQQLEAPPLVSQETGCAGYRLAATDDGVIAPIEALATCGESGQRVLQSEIVVCRQSGAAGAAVPDRGVSHLGRSRIGGGHVDLPAVRAAGGALGDVVQGLLGLPAAAPGRARRTTAEAVA